MTARASGTGPSEQQDSTRPLERLERLERRAGVVIAVACVASLALYPLLLVDPVEIARVRLRPYYTIVAVGMVLAALSAAPRLRPGSDLTRCTNAPSLWATILVATVAGAVGTSGGAYSELHYLAGLPLVFAALVYEPRRLRALLYWTAAAFLIVQLSSSSPPLPARTLARIAAIGGAVTVTAWLRAENRRELELTRQARDEADRRAGNLRALAASARSINDLDHAVVLEAVGATALELGYDGAAFIVPRQGTADLVDPVGALRSMSLPQVATPHDLDLALRGATVSARMVRGMERRLVAIRVGDRTVAALVAVTLTPAITDPDGAGLRVLACQTAHALANADRYRSANEIAHQLRDLERVRDDTISTASHELRTPTTIIKAAAELLHHRWELLEEDERRHFVARMVNSIEDLERVLDQLTELMRMTGESMPLERTPVDLRGLVASALAMHGERLSEHVVALDVQDDDIEVDGEALRRALGELLHNAAVHTPGGTTVHVWAARSADTLTIRVSDDGPGVDPGEVKGLARAFSRSGDVLTRTTRGLGLGLHFVSQVVTAHGGTLSLASAGGFLVELTLPLTATGVERPEDAEPHHGPVALVVEDDKDMQQLIRMALEHAGCTVLVAGDGRTALTLAAAHALDVIVLDVGLPGLDGREVARLLRDTEATAAVPIVVCTGSAASRDLWSIWASGADALLTKPFQINELVSTVLDAALVTVDLREQSYAAAAGPSRSA